MENNNNILQQQQILDDKDSEANTSMSSYDNINNIEQYKQEQNKKMENLKQLLIKAKSTIQKLKQENQGLDKQIQDYKVKNEQMEKLIKKYLDSKEEDIGDQSSNGGNIVKKYKNQNAKIEEIQAKIVLNGITWVCIRFDNYSIEWVREEHLDLEELQQQKSQNQIIEMPTCIDYNRFAEKEQEQEKKSKNYDNDLKNVITQYEERIKRMHENSGQMEQKVEELEGIIKNQKNSSQSQNDILRQICQQIIGDSEQIKENCLQVMVDQEMNPEEENEKKQQIKYLLIKLQKMNIIQQQQQQEQGSSGLEMVNELKDHILILLQTLFDILKRHKIEIEEYQEEQEKLQQKQQKLAKELKSEKQEKQIILDQGRSKIKELDQRYEKYKSESILQMKEKDVKIDFLNKELKKNVNNQYLKNILIKFFMAQGKKDVQKKMLMGIQTVLQFTEDEVSEVNQALFQDELQSSGFLGGFFNAFQQQKQQ